MSGTSSIEWTDATWNPVRGCSMAKGSETGGCLREEEPSGTAPKLLARMRELTR